MIPSIRTSILFLTLSVSACGVQQAPRGLLGSYRLEDGRILSIRPSVGHTLRYREYRTGATGRLHPATENLYEAGSGFSNREPVAVTVEFQTDATGLAERVLFDPQNEDGIPGTRIGRESWVRFESDGVWLTGRLHLPEGPGPFPGIVLVHGSGEDPGSDWLFNGDFLVAHGFAILAYDKRGTGGSEGDFTFDFHQLARDAAAGVEFLGSHAEVDDSRIGLSGYSQGAWVAPLAASLTDVQFVLVSYGMIESPAEEAHMEMLHLLEEGGVSGEDLLQADSLVSAAIQVVASDLKEGWERFQGLRGRYGKAPWMRFLDGTPVDQLVSYPKWVVKLIGPRQLPDGLPWNYDSAALLETSCVPMSWFLAEQDESAPNRFTIPKLRRLEAAGRPLELTVFPGTDHGMLRFREVEGQREYLDYAPGYFESEVEAALRWSSGTRSGDERAGCS